MALGIINCASLSALFQSMMFASFQGLFRSSNCSSPSLLLISWAIR